MSAGEVLAFRLAVRAEGAAINAYLAPIGTMSDAKLVGSIHRGACEIDRTLFDDFVALMQRAVSAVTKEAVGLEPLRYEREAAPEHEKAGRA